MRNSDPVDWWIVGRSCVKSKNIRGLSKASRKTNVKRWLYSGMLRRVIWWKLTDVSEVFTSSIIRAMSKLPRENGECMQSHVENASKFFACSLRITLTTETVNN
jgi:hypothetical protein